MNATGALSTPDVVVDQSHISIRGVRLHFDELMDERQLAPDNASRLREELRNSQPFEHLVFKDLFNERLLQLIYDEFDLSNNSTWSRLSNSYEETRRSTRGATLGPAAQLFFWLVNSAHVTQFLSAISGVEELIPDPTLYGGGMHATVNGGRFNIHRDFEVNEHTRLVNAMVLITYLNKDWSRSYEGLLELWDGPSQQCVKKVSPDFGTSLLMCHGPNSYHGYSTPLNLPPGRTRRSVAAYYYKNEPPATQKAPVCTSAFLFSERSDVAKRAIKRFIPPVLWDALKRFKR